MGTMTDFDFDNVVHKNPDNWTEIPKSPPRGLLLRLAASLPVGIFLTVVLVFPLNVVCGVMLGIQGLTLLRVIREWRSREGCDLKECSHCRALVCMKHHQVVRDGI